MSGSSVVFLSIRVLHVLLAAFWVGATVFSAIFLNALLADSDRDVAAAILRILDRRKLQAFLASVGGLTVLTGFWLYWRFTGHFNPQLSASMGARVFGTGGVAGLIALIVDGAVASRTAKKMMAAAARAATMPAGAERDALAAQIVTGRGRLVTATTLVLVLQIIALATMTIGHYV